MTRRLLGKIILGVAIALPLCPRTFVVERTQKPVVKCGPLSRGRVNWPPVDMRDFMVRTQIYLNQLNYNEL